VIPVYEPGRLPDDGWRLYRKMTLTRMRPVVGPIVIVTQEGRYELPEGWRGFVAVDTAGFPYPIEATEHARTYEEVEP
jgi:hypothetical protein